MRKIPLNPRSSLLIAAGAALGVAAALWTSVWAVIFVLGFATLSVVMLRALGAFKDLDTQMSDATIVFFALKVAMAVLSLEATTLVFAGSADALGYDNTGKQILQSWNLGLPAVYQPFPGTGGIQLLVAHLYQIATPNISLGFLVFSWASGVATILLWHGASRTWAWPNRRQLGLALMFLPSLLYWTSPISKEALVLLGTGFFVLGMGYIFDGYRPLAGMAFAFLGGGIAYIVRPNITLLLVTSAVAAFVIPWSKRVTRRPSTLMKVLVVGVLVVMLVPLVAVNRQLLHLKPGQAFVQGSLNTISGESTIGGGSAFQTASPTSIIGVPYAVISVLFRPFPWEDRTALQMTSSAESIFITSWCVLILLRWRRRLIRPRLDGLFIMSAVFLLIFCLIYSSVGNFGLLVRERVTVLPFLLIMLTSFEATSATELTHMRDLIGRRRTQAIGGAAQRDA